MIAYAAVAIGVAFVVLVGYLIPLVIQLRRTVTQSEKLLAQLNTDLPLLLKDVRVTAANVQTMTTQAKQSVDRAAVLFNAIGNIGQTVDHIHGTVRGKSTAMVLNLARFLAGVKAATSTIRERVHHEKRGGHTDG